MHAFLNIRGKHCFCKQCYFSFQATKMLWVTSEYTNLWLFQMRLVFPGLVFLVAD